MSGRLSDGMYDIHITLIRFALIRTTQPIKLMLLKVNRV